MGISGPRSFSCFFVRFSLGVFLVSTSFCQPGSLSSLWGSLFPSCCSCTAAGEVFCRPQHAKPPLIRSACPGRREGVQRASRRRHEPSFSCRHREMSPCLVWLFCRGSVLLCGSFSSSFSSSSPNSPELSPSCPSSTLAARARQHRCPRPLGPLVKSFFFLLFVCVPSRSMWRSYRRAI